MRRQLLISPTGARDEISRLLSDARVRSDCTTALAKAEVKGTVHYPKRVLTACITIGVGVLTLAFGAYLLYEKVILSISRGVLDERIGLIDRADEPWSFWFGVAMYGFIGAMIVIAGGCFLAWISRQLLARFKR